MYAIVDVKGFQFKVQPDAVIRVPSMDQEVLEDLRKLQNILHHMVWSIGSFCGLSCDIEAFRASTERFMT